MNFNFLGLKKLIATCYVTSPVMYTQLSLFDDMEQPVLMSADPSKKPYKVEITEVTDENGDGAFDLEDIKHLLKNKNNVCTVLEGDGDFRSNECIELLKEADIVVTNPPFSLFREYVAQLVEYNKKFIIIGNQNAITYKEIFPLLKDNKMWLGFGFKRNCAHFINKHYQDTASDLDHREGMIRVSGVVWFTNLDIQKRHESMILYKNYDPKVYLHYDNYDAINVDKTADIPCDYDGVMGVPITFLEKYNPEQFEIVGGSMYDDTPCRIIKNYTELGYKFLKADGITVSGSGALRDKMSPKIPIKGNSDYSISPEGEYLSSVYQRIFIRRKG